MVDKDSLFSSCCTGVTLASWVSRAEACADGPGVEDIITRKDFGQLGDLYKVADGHDFACCVKADPNGCYSRQKEGRMRIAGSSVESFVRVRYEWRICSGIVHASVGRDQRVTTAMCRVDYISFLDI